jgi:nucleotide-binding universal stress UspA family protein
VSQLLIAVDFSNNSTPAVRAAAWLCRELGHAATLVYTTEPEVLTGSESEARLQESLAGWARTRLGRIAREELEDVDVTTRLVEGARGASEGIVDAAKELDAGLIVMGTHGRTALEHRILGSTATSVVRHAECDVLTVRPPLPGDEPLDVKLRNWVLTRAEGAIDTVLCPTDFSHGAARAEHRAALLADRFGAELSLLHVVALPFWAGDGSEAGERMRGEAQDRMVEAIERARKRGARVHGRVVEGTVHQAILAQAAADEADLIIMGTEGKTGLKRWAIGSVAERVVRTSMTPVWTVRVDPQRLDSQRQDPQRQDSRLA